jgi:hypothetical protein
MRCSCGSGVVPAMAPLRDSAWAAQIRPAPAKLVLAGEVGPAPGPSVQIGFSGGRDEARDGAVGLASAAREGKRSHLVAAVEQRRAVRCPALRPWLCERRLRRPTGRREGVGLSGSGAVSQARLTAVIDATVVRCAECAREVDEFTAIKERWTYWSHGVGELEPYCPECATREFAPDAPAGTDQRPRSSHR